MEYTNGQRVIAPEYPEDGVLLVIGERKYPSGDTYVVCCRQDGERLLCSGSLYDGFHPDVLTALPTREERIESLIDDYVFAAVDFGLSLELGGDDACSRRAALFAILDAEIPE